MGKDKTNEIKPEKHKKEMTEKAIQANKLNALKSTGPRTQRAEGEAPPNLKHGILASIKVLPEVESQQEWDDFVVGLKEDLHPSGTLEVALVERIAWILWRFKRLVNYEEGNLNLKFVRSLEDYVNTLVYSPSDDFTNIVLMLTYYGFSFFVRIVTSFHKIKEIIRNIKIGVVTGSIDTELGTDTAKLLGLVQFWLLCRGNEKNAAIRYSNNMVDFVNFDLKIHDKVFLIYL